MVPRVLPSQARRRALAELDALLARAERNHAAYLALAERVAVAGGDAGAARARERFARERVEQLRRSREILVGGDAGRQGEW